MSTLQLVEPPKGKPQSQSGLYLMAGKHRIPFETANEASGIILEMGEQSGLGASALGSMFPVVDSTGKEVGYVSYNGRVWQGTRKNWKTAVCVYEP